HQAACQPPPLEAAPTSTACSLNSRSWAQWTAPPPIATDTHRDALAPIERHAHGLQAKICCSCSWLHFLKSWSLLKTRCDSLLSKSPDELAKAFKEMGIEDIGRDKVIEHLKNNGKVAALPIIFQVLGPRVALGIIETVIISIITKIIGREAA